MAPDTLRGTVERITYHNEETGYTVAQLMPDTAASRSAAATSEMVTVVGAMVGINVGESVVVEGSWVAHPQYGRQFRSDNISAVLPATAAGIEKYLGSGLIKGIGPVTAKRIVGRFGANTLRVIEAEPQRLLDVPGVGRGRIDMIARAWAQQQAIKEVMLFLQSHNVSTGLAVRIYKHYGEQAVAVLQTDPYRLAREVHGVGFITADKIAHELGIAHDAPERIAAGAAYVLSRAADEGSVYLPAGELRSRSAALLQVAATQVDDGIRVLQDTDQVRVEGIMAYRPLQEAPGLARDTTGGQPLAIADTCAVYLVPFYVSEVGVAGRLRRLLDASTDRLAAFRSFNWPAAFAALARQIPNRDMHPTTLTPRQMEAVQAALQARVCVLTGGPGTGKTTTVRSILRLAEAAGVRVAMASPTGRAAKRLSEATGRPAKTVHRLLEFKPTEGLTFQRNEHNPIEADLLIVDEASMLDLLLTNHLLKAVSPGAHVLLVGDADQLPSVGAGNVLRDVIAAIEEGGLSRATVVRLDTIFRQPEGSYIITNAHRINTGQMPVLDNRSSLDFFLFKEEDPARAADILVDLVRERIPRRFGLPPEQIQVLSPMHRGAVGVSALNTRLQDALNPPRPNVPERQVSGRVFRPGDKVMQTRNNYDKEVFNGDIGQIARIDSEEQVVTVVIDDRVVSYDFLDLDDLSHAYAISIHKAQGSEYPAVVIPLLTTHYVMLQRNLLYTAVTRAQKLAVLVGTSRAIGIAVRNDRSQDRFSGLARRLSWQ